MSVKAESTTCVRSRSPTPARGAVSPAISVAASPKGCASPMPGKEPAGSKMAESDSEARQREKACKTDVVMLNVAAFADTKPSKAVKFGFHGWVLQAPDGVRQVKKSAGQVGSAAASSKPEGTAPCLRLSETNRSLAAQRER